jgi:hypothetical protein
MKSKKLNDFTKRMLLALKTAQMDGDRDVERQLIDALVKAHGIPASYAA